MCNYALLASPCLEIINAFNEHFIKMIDTSVIITLKNKQVFN